MRHLALPGLALLCLWASPAQAQSSLAHGSQAQESQGNQAPGAPERSGSQSASSPSGAVNQSGTVQLLTPGLTPAAPATEQAAPLPSSVQPNSVQTSGVQTSAPASTAGAVFTLPGMTMPSLLPVPTVTVTTTPEAPASSAAPTTPNITVPPEVVPVVPVPPAVSTPKPSTSATGPTTITIHAARPSNLRGLWVDAFGPGLKTPALVRQMVTDAAALGVNTLFVQTIRRADCLCNLASVPRAADRELSPGFDPLAEVITLAHAKNIRVIAWVSVTGAGSSSAPNPSPLHVLQQHGPAALADSWVNRRADGSYLEGGDIWLDAGIPAASDFMAQSILSLVKNYNIDGIQFDRIRYPDGGNWGYSPLALTRYRAETGAVGTPLPSDPRWTAWKRQQITALVRRVALEARFLKPQLWITAATITYGAPPSNLAGFEKSRTYSDVVQDWPTWTQSGLLDLNVLMNYKQDAVPNHIQWFDGWNAFALSVAGEGEAAAGTALYLNTPQVSRDQYLRATALGMGWVGYAYRTPTLEVYKGGLSQAQGFEELRQALTGKSAADKERGLNVGPWTAAPPQRYGVLGHIRGPLLPGGRTVEAYSAAGTLLATTQTDGNGYYGFASLPAGIVDVRIEGQHWQQTLVRPGVARLPDILLQGTKLMPAHALPLTAPAPLMGTPRPTGLPAQQPATQQTAAQQTARPPAGGAVQSSRTLPQVSPAPAAAVQFTQPVAVPSSKKAAPKVNTPKASTLKTNTLKTSTLKSVTPKSNAPKAAPAQAVPSKAAVKPAAPKLPAPKAKAASPKKAATKPKKP